MSVKRRSSKLAARGKPEKARRKGGMFARRLALLALAMFAACSGLLAQGVWLGAATHETALEEAENRLYRVTWSPSVRGRVYDRKGRLLARDRASYAVAVDYRVLTGEWARAHARSTARSMHRDAWGLLAPEQRERLIADAQPMFDRHVRRAWTRLSSLTGVPEADLRDRADRTLARVDRLRASIEVRRHRDAMIDAIARGRQQTPELLEEIEQRARIELLEQRQSHVLVEDVPDEVAFELIRLAGAAATIVRPDGEPMEVDLLPGLEIQRSADRIYPFDQIAVDVDRSLFPQPIRSDEPLTVPLTGVAAHILGWVRPGAHSEDIQRRSAMLDSDRAQRAHALTGVVGGRSIDRGRYRPGDSVGRGGVEYAREGQLRGLRGVTMRRLDTGDRVSEAPQPGGDVRLTIDIMLQARVRALLEPEVGLALVQPWHANQGVDVGTPLRGAAVVIEVDTGDVLAMVSTPGIDRSMLDEDPQAVLDDPDRPLFNRAVGSAYAPGSIAKALVLCGAVTHGHFQAGDTVSCEGHLLPGRNDIYRCWIYRDRFGFATHDAVLAGEPDDIDALCVSCNIFFYTLGRRMGVDRLRETYEAFGLGERFDFGVGFEHEGRMGTPGMNLGMSDAILMGIGQGPVDWTPMHAASSYATLARLGTHIKPRLYMDEASAEPRATGMDRGAIARALRGLDRVTNDERFGTAYAIRFPDGRDRIFNTPGTRVLGKTGTATVELRDDAGERIKRDHAWMVALAGPEHRPASYAVCVLLEQGGSGGRAAGGLLNQVVRAMRDEGYW